LRVPQVEFALNPTPCFISVTRLFCLNQYHRSIERH